MGQMVMYDQYLSRAAVSDFSVFSLDDVDAAFSQIHQLRYQQHVAFSGTRSPLCGVCNGACHQYGHCLVVDGKALFAARTSKCSCLFRNCKQRSV